MTEIDWYDRRDELEPGMIVLDHTGDRLRLSERVPGDGTDWYCDVWYEKTSGGGYWAAEMLRIHPGDIASVEGK